METKISNRNHSNRNSNHSNGRENSLVIKLHLKKLLDPPPPHCPHRGQRELRPRCRATAAPTRLKCCRFCSRNLLSWGYEFFEGEVVAMGIFWGYLQEIIFFLLFFGKIEYLQKIIGYFSKKVIFPFLQKNVQTPITMAP